MSDNKPLIIVPEHVREPSFTWVVLMKGKDGNPPFRTEISGFNMFLDAGCLVFRQKDGKILTAIPAGSWEAVEFKP